MSKARPVSAGLVMVRRRPSLRFLLVHPGGPFYAKRDDHVWSIPKGLPDEGEALLDAAKRELREETGHEPPEGGYISLGFVKQTRKDVHAWAFVDEDWDPTTLISARFEMEWPPRSGKRASFPEADRAAFFTLEEAAPRVVRAQLVLLERAHTAFAP
jgi:predicted NUDIX family NTP pyrophosphohydrolase